MNITKGKQYIITIKAAKMTNGIQPEATLLVEITKCSTYSCSYRTIHVIEWSGYGFTDSQLSAGGFSLSNVSMSLLNIQAV